MAHATHPIGITREDILAEVTEIPPGLPQDALVMAARRDLAGTELGGLHVYVGWTAPDRPRLEVTEYPEDRTMSAADLLAGMPVAQGDLSPKAREWYERYRAARRMEGTARREALEALEPATLELRPWEERLNFPGEETAEE